VGYTALLDANVLHPVVLCDLLLRLALAGFYRPVWSARILEETERSLRRRRPDIAPDRLRRRSEQMNEAFPDAQVGGFEDLIPQLAGFGHDAHVVAAAIRGTADVIVTANVGDFPADRLARFDLVAQAADDFLIHQWWLDPAGVLRAIEEQAAALKRPPLSTADVVERLARVVPTFARLVRESEH
jgi:hypothetical protein